MRDFIFFLDAQYQLVTLLTMLLDRNRWPSVRYKSVTAAGNDDRILTFVCENDVLIEALVNV